MEIKYVVLNKKAKRPKKGSDKAGGHDVYATEIIKEEDDYYRVKIGLQMQPEPGYCIRFSPRSSITKTKWIIQNSPVLGDEDYIGEYEIRFRAFPEGVITSLQGASFWYPKFSFKVGDRIAQLYAEEVIPLKFKKVEQLEETSRGAGGFGSTGK